MTDEHFYPFKKHNIVRRKESALGRSVSFVPEFDGGACGKCGFWGGDDAREDHRLCSTFCVNCRKRESEHSAGWCLFQPTRFETGYYEWTVT